MYEKSIELLNKAVADELSAIHQYMYFHFHCDDQGFDLLANHFKRTAIDEMTHVETLAESIDRFGPNYLALQTIERSKNISNPPA
ncbi:MAG: ferritin-like domain-containing protein [bacterium]